MKKVIQSMLAPEAIGPYSQAIEINGMVFTSGQIPLNPKTGEIVGATIEEQTEQVMQNLKAVLAQASVGMDHVVKATCYLADLADFAAFNAVYGKYFAQNAPARSCVQVAALPKGAKVEVELVATKA
jgi:2-iminobutanoate/2-iminopropanoate deaminase